MPLSRKRKRNGPSKGERERRRRIKQRKEVIRARLFQAYGVSPTRPDILQDMMLLAPSIAKKFGGL